VTEIFSRFFESRVAVTPEEIERSLRVRYEVYCQEAAYFPPDNYSNGLEQDAYDERSAHSVLIYQPTERPIGAVRLVLPGGDADPMVDFPFELVCPPERLVDLKVPRESSAEISRFCLTRRLAEEIGRTSPDVFESLLSSAGGGSLEPRQFVRTAKLGLLRAIVDMSVRNGITHWWAVMEPRLIRSLDRLGVHFVHLGEPIDYYGLRQPCYGEVDTVLHIMRQERFDVWRVTTDDGNLWS